jgi:hypothetical protein
MIAQPRGQNQLQPSRWGIFGKQPACFDKLSVGESGAPRAVLAPQNLPILSLSKDAA